MSSAEQLYLLADHIKLSLLERQRAQSLGLDSDSQDGHLSRSLEQFKTGLESLETEHQKLQNSGDNRYRNPRRNLPAVLTVIPGYQRDIIFEQLDFISPGATGKPHVAIPRLCFSCNHRNRDASQFRSAG